MDKANDMLEDLKPCPLCLSLNSYLFYISTRKNLERKYYKCDVCFMIFVPRKFHISPTQQKLRYLEHENDINNQDYRSFLSPVVKAILPNIKVGDTGLDYGSGPGPALAQMLSDSGMIMSIYDIYFNRDPIVLNEKYDFITCTETVEHFVEPYCDFEKMIALIKPKGVLAIMTSILYKDIDFENWYYNLDPTHVSFYTPDTIGWIANKWELDLHSPSRNIFILHKKNN